MSLGGQTRPGVLMHVFIASDYNGGTFGKAITPNSTSSPQKYVLSPVLICWRQQ
ncbi:MAG TPA: hypothetical protein VEL11_10670 [Candidatus Bathyarchaeia archaeon]|nr:hypothetical protein [Candidatus Bathyarchaeia archaeon]